MGLKGKDPLFSSSLSDHVAIKSAVKRERILYVWLLQISKTDSSAMFSHANGAKITAVSLVNGILQANTIRAIVIVLAVAL